MAYNLPITFYNVTVYLNEPWARNTPSGRWWYYFDPFQKSVGNTRCDSEFKFCLKIQFLAMKPVENYLSETASFFSFLSTFNLKFNCQTLT